MVEQPLRMHDGPRAFSAGASVCIVNSEQFSAVLTVNQRLLLRPRELFNCRLALHGLALRVEHFAVRELDRTAAARVFRALSAVVRVQTGGKVVRPAAVEGPVRTFQKICVVHVILHFTAIPAPACILPRHSLLSDTLHVM